MRTLPKTLTLCLLLALAVAGCAQPEPPSSAISLLGINLNGPADWNTELPFVDCFHLAREWISQREGSDWGQGPALALDEAGWIKQLETGCYAETPLCTIEGGHYPTGEYVCLYEGRGELEFWNIKREVSREPGRIVFEPDPARGGFFLRLKTTDPADYVRNIRVVMPGFEATCQTNPWRPDFLARWKGFAVLRFMDWMLTNGASLISWEDRPKPEDATWTRRGIPLELMLDLANRLGADPWFCIPHQADDDYARKFAEQVKRDLRPDLKVYIEYSNELWNGGFEQTRWTGQKGIELGLASNEWEGCLKYSARRSVELFKIWEEVFGGADRLVRVMATQSVNPWVSEQKLEFEEAFRHCDALAVAPYFGPIVPPEGDEGQPGAADVAKWTVGQLLDYVEFKTLPEALKSVAQQKATAEKYGLKLVAYEAGQHLVGIQGAENNETLTALFLEANSNPRMGEFYTRYLDGWKATGGDVCCLFSSIGAWSKWGSWGLAQYYDETPEQQPKLKAVLDWNLANPRASS